MPNDALDYSRELYKNVLEWRKDAETKAQLVLTLNGVFLTFLSTTTLTKPKDLQAVVASFGLVSWFFLILMALSLLVSMSHAVRCLTSAPLSNKELAELFARHEIDPGDPTTYKPHVMWYFQTIAELPQDKFVTRAGTIDATSFREALSIQTSVLSGRILRKFTLVRVAFSFTGVALASFLVLGVGRLLGTL